jgi:phosphoribosylanthranilate isomerase
VTRFQPPKVKICGITNLDDAIVAMEAGADYLGFIFYPPSPRSISKDKARQITAQLRGERNIPILVGVFVNESAESMAETLEYCHLDLAQLSGDETPDLIGEVDSPVYGRSYKAIRPQSLAEAETEAEWYRPPQRKDNQPELLVDTHHATLYGGTGLTANWSMAARLIGQVPGLMLAGGLNPSNVAEAVSLVRPFAVDVASGVEASPGHKDQDLVRSFITNAKTEGTQEN